MIRYIILISILWMGCAQSSDPVSMEQDMPPNSHPAYTLVIHGGAGTILPQDFDEDKVSMYEQALHQALDSGEQILAQGGSASEAIIAAIISMENQPIFNAGRGAVLTHQGTCELDASIMDGKSGQAGAVGGVSIVKNPILAAQAVMLHSAHVLLTGDGADAFSVEQGLDTVSNDYFMTQRSMDALKRVRKQEKQSTGHIIGNDQGDWKFGTVGAVALDAQGNLAAGTSTGGMTNKKYRRLGDSPIIGAGTYAANDCCAVSCTGHGEYFIRQAVAYDLCARMRYTQDNLLTAAHAIVFETLQPKGGHGGLIAVDAQGNIAMPFNTPGMFRAYARPGVRKVAMFGADD